MLQHITVCLGGRVAEEMVFDDITTGASQDIKQVTDTARSILDGHIVLSRKIAQKNHYPAIDVLASISRCMSQIVDKKQKELSGQLKNVMATYAESEDLINIGAYKAGSNKNIDYAISKIDKVNDFLIQATDEKMDYDEEIEALEAVFEEPQEGDEN